jgi:hypothetical protein
MRVPATLDTVTMSYRRTGLLYAVGQIEGSEVTVAKATRTIKILGRLYYVSKPGTRHGVDDRGVSECIEDMYSQGD